MRVTGRRRPKSSDQWPAGDLLAGAVSGQKGAIDPNAVHVVLVPDPTSAVPPAGAHLLQSFLAQRLASRVG